jgi:hypothetical protein
MIQARGDVHLPMERKPLTKERIEYLCMEETIRDLPRIQYEMEEARKMVVSCPPPFAGKHITAQFYSLVGAINVELEARKEKFNEIRWDYEDAMRIKRAFAELTSWEWAEYIHQSAILDFYSNMTRK